MDFPSLLLMTHSLNRWVIVLVSLPDTFNMSYWAYEKPPE